jgi:hypothetical protein
MTPEQKQAALELITAQIAALDDILRRCSIELNFVRCKERMLQWQKDAVPLIAQQIGAKEGRQFADVRPGPAFTNDLMEEVSDEADTFRNWLQRLAADIKKR